MLTAYPTNGAAQDAEMSLAEYEDFIYDAALLDDGDPVARWRAFADELQRVAEFLSTKEELRFVAEGTDLTFGVGGDRTWVAADGHENFPDGEVFTAPLDESAEGEITFTFPAVFQRPAGGRRAPALPRGRGGRGHGLARRGLPAGDGRPRRGRAARGGVRLRPERAVRVFTRNILFDEKIGGTMHLALGSAYPECGGTTARRCTGT